MILVMLSNKVIMLEARKNAAVQWENFEGSAFLDTSLNPDSFLT
jgi:hypothetical protein